MKTTNKKKDFQLLWFALTSIIITIVVVIYWIIVDKMEDKSTFGDVFGGLTAWFSGLAFAGIILTILQQKKELQYQREELRLTRNEFKTQNYTLQKQRFENTFFNLFKFHNDIIDKLFFLETTRHERHQVFQFLHGQLKGTLLNKITSDSSTGRNQGNNNYSIQELEDLIVSTIGATVTMYTNNLQVYFKSLRQLKLFVHESDLLQDEKERTFYMNMIKGQMTEYEKVMVLYVSIMKVGWVKEINYLLKKYSILDDINKELLLTNRDMEVFDVSVENYIKQVE